METAIEYLLKSAGVLSIFVLVYHFLLRRLTFFNANRWFLLAGIAASILFPLVEITQTVYVEQPEQVVYLPQQLATPMASVLQQPTVEETAVAFDYAMLFFYLYVAISIFFIGKMIVELSSLRSLISSGDKKRSGKFVIVTLSRKLTPFSFFNYICYSTSDQQSPELDLILEHEKVHAREWHSIDLIASHLFKALFWINPLVWLLKRQIGENLEFIADSKAKVKNTTGISYERTLLSAAASHMQPALANNFFTPFIKKRIVMLQKEASANWNAYKYALILPVIVLFLYSFNVVEEIEYVKNENALQMDSVTNNNDESSIIDTIENATTTSEEEIGIAQELWSEDPIIDFDHTINFSIEPTSTKEYLDEKKTYLKKEYNVDFNYSKLKIKRGKIVRIKISIDDNNGYKGSQEYSATSGIKSICVKGEIEGDSKSWSMGDCTGVANKNSYSTITSSYTYTSDSDSLVKSGDSLITIAQMEELIAREEARNAVIFSMMESTNGKNIDSLLNSDSFQFNDIDSLKNMIQARLKNVHLDSLNVIYFDSPKTVHTSKNGVSTTITKNVSIEKLDLGENSALMIVNGKETNAEIANLIDPKLIESVSVLKNKEATSLYGEKATNGVVLITTKNADMDNRQALIMSKKQEMLQKREEMKAGYAARRDSLISIRTEVKEGRRSQYQQRRDSLINKKTEIKEARRAELLEKIGSKRVSRVGYGDTNVVYVYPSDNIESEFHFDDMSEERFEKLRERLEDAGHTFKLKTHRMKNDRLVKLKFDIDGSQYAYQSTAGYKELKIVFKEGSDSPSISMVPFK
ncbi:M56 family metallopeptidase [Nonlabens sp. Asnod2-A12]|uniref:M56 family metallopeptidase n=1 Tax=Nonlabens sp. Asnod2-A12 TaxID=3160578 RepID=UPI00386F2C01